MNAQIHAVLTFVNTCALAALAVVSAASAQSALTISGNMSAGQSSIDGAKNIAGLDTTNSNLINFKATEDLGGGWSATANMGMRFDVNRGANATASTTVGSETVPGVAAPGIKNTGDAYVEIASTKFGAVRAGTWTFHSGAQFNAFNTWTTSRLDGEQSISSQNQVSYKTPSIYGLVASVSQFSATTPTGTGDKTAENGTALKLDYTNGPLNVAYVYQEYAAAVTLNAVEYSALGGSYDFGVAKLYAMVWDNKAATGITDSKGNSFSIAVPYQAWTFKAGMRNAKAATVSVANTDRTSVGVEYSMSKRTTLVSNLSKNKQANTGAGKTTNYYVGANHSF